jgi:streptogramin lyase
MRAAGGRAETACMRNLPFLPRVAAVVAMVVVAGLSASAANASQRLTTYKLPEEFALPNDMAIGPDGATWVTDSSLGRIWRISESGRIRHYELGQMPGAITVAHGSMWVAALRARRGLVPHLDRRGRRRRAVVHRGSRRRDRPHHRRR